MTDLFKTPYGPVTRNPHPWYEGEVVWSAVAGDYDGDTQAAQRALDWARMNLQPPAVSPPHRRYPAKRRS